MAGGPGFEPGLAESESAVLPLDDPPINYDSIAAGKGVRPQFRCFSVNFEVEARAKLGSDPVIFSAVC